MNIASIDLALTPLGRQLQNGGALVGTHVGFAMHALGSAHQADVHCDYKQQAVLHMSDLFPATVPSLLFFLESSWNAANTIKRREREDRACMCVCLCTGRIEKRLKREPLEKEKERKKG